MHKKKEAKNKNEISTRQGIPNKKKANAGKGVQTEKKRQKESRWYATWQELKA